MQINLFSLLTVRAGIIFFPSGTLDFREKNDGLSSARVSVSSLRHTMGSWWQAARNTGSEIKKQAFVASLRKSEKILSDHTGHTIASVAVLRSDIVLPLGINFLFMENECCKSSLAVNISRLQVLRAINCILMFCMLPFKIKDSKSTTINNSFFQ